MPIFSFGFCGPGCCCCSWICLKPLNIQSSFEEISLASTKSLFTRTMSSEFFEEAGEIIELSVNKWFKRLSLGKTWLLKFSMNVTVSFICFMVYSTSKHLKYLINRFFASLVILVLQKVVHSYKQNCFPNRHNRVKLYSVEPSYWVPWSPAGGFQIRKHQ